MHAILLIAATHLSFLVPTEQSYHHASVQHLSKTLHLFGLALSQPRTSANADAFMATATILVHHAWATIDAIRCPPASNRSIDSTATTSRRSTLDLSHDPLFTLSDGLNAVFMNAIEFIALNDSIFAASIQHRPRYSILCALRDLPNCLEELEMFFSECYIRMAGNHSPQLLLSEGINSSMSIADTSFACMPATGSTENNKLEESETMNNPEVFSAFKDAASRLALVLALFQKLPSASGGIPPTTPAPVIDTVAPSSNFPPLTDLARYLFSFPTRSTGPFFSLVRRNDPRAFILLFYFYRAVRLLLPEKQCWWSCARAEYLEKEIGRTFGDAGKLLIEEGNRVLERGISTINS
jgi:hypothetical protein